jgi:hypothetical protein
LSFDIRRVPYENLLQLEDLIPIVVDSKGIIRLKLLELKLKKGLTGYADQNLLKRISLPFLKNGKYRATGDSMPPHKEVLL